MDESQERPVLFGALQEGTLIEFVQKPVCFGDLEQLVTSGSEAKGTRDIDPMLDALKTLNGHRTHDTRVHGPL